jgi:hypothetical protein
MVKKSQITLNNDQKQKIEETFKELTLTEFLNSKIRTEDGITPGTGFEVSPAHGIGSDTTYK